MNLTELPNIDDKMALQLEKAGVTDAQKLKILGAEKAFLLLREVNPKAELKHLFILEAAVQGIPVEKLSRAKKEELEMFFELCK
ncbi:MAG: TfoX/Sxy family protein [Bacteroidales bacterium]|nr:TfoX/Sxy family protein [Bacteroidales bacterium]